ncbi:hypothetical protein [uncultured Ferrimonas sp.]|uniref:hypothetical protein n=1 Tax=uncultured Ferrimonas sp. TaxID=432640 RepID=UPI00263A2CA5|nr:hypothetical protein [uncultured Ferrimonas sp.]
MRFIFVDAENTGLKEVEELPVTIEDRVLIFSRLDAIKQICERRFFHSLSCYPSGSNQADFYIIGHLVGLIASLSEAQRLTAEFILHTRDNALIAAFQFQCKLHRLKHQIKGTMQTSSASIDTVSIPTGSPPLSLEQRICLQFHTAQTAESVRKKLSQPKADFLRSFNSLVQTKKLKRVSKSKKTWIKS